MSDSTAALGSLGVTFFFSLTNLPTIVAEWAALLPLILHLANPRFDAELVGRVSLLGRLSTDIFPRLGTARSISRLLENPGRFLDQTSAANKQVWDVKHGGRFPSANGAASDTMTDTLARHVQPGPAVERTTVPKVSEHENKEHKPSAAAHPKASETQFRRPQRLRIFHCRRKEYKRLSKMNPSEWQDKAPATMLYVVGMVGVAVVLGLYGLFGTCACLIISVISTVACRLVKFRRVANFLKSNEIDKSGGLRPDGCMLCATHPNSYEWDLFVGDRGIIDALLNKPMITIDDVTSQWLVVWFRSADVLQLLAMTFAAAQKGWDGVALVILMLSDWLVVFITNMGGRVVRNFMRDNHLSVKVWTLDFPGKLFRRQVCRLLTDSLGRVAMLAAIHRCSGSDSWTWMDDIIVPTSRRDALLRQSQREDLRHVQTLSEVDRDWVCCNLKWTRDAVGRIEQAFIYSD